MPPTPDPNDTKYKPKFGVIIFQKRAQTKALEKFQKNQKAWELKVQKRTEHYNEININLKISYERQLKEYEEKLKNL